MVFVHGWGLGREKESFWPEPLEGWSRHQPRWGRLREEKVGEHQELSSGQVSLRCH